MTYWKVKCEPTRSTLLLSLSLFLLVGCGENTCSGNISDYDGDHLTVIGLENLQALERLPDGSLKALDESTPVQIENLEFRVKLKFVSDEGEIKSTYLSPLDWLINSAYACSPDPGSIRSELVGMHMLSNASLGSSYAPGTLLDSVFFAEELIRDDFEYPHFHEMDSRIMDEFNPSDPATAGVFYALTPLSNDANGILAPDTTELHQFTYTIDLANGESYEAISEAVLIAATE